MDPGILHLTVVATLTAFAGTQMVRIGQKLRALEMRRRDRWCAACHRRVTAGRCGCS